MVAHLSDFETIVGGGYSDAPNSLYFTDAIYCRQTGREWNTSLRRVEGRTGFRRLVSQSSLKHSLLFQPTPCQ